MQVIRFVKLLLFEKLSCLGGSEGALGGAEVEEAEDFVLRQAQVARGGGLREDGGEQLPLLFQDLIDPLFDRA